MNWLILLGCMVVATYDLITTINGSMEILGYGPVQICMAALFGVMISTFLLRTYSIWRMRTTDPLKAALKLLWLLAFAYDLATSLHGNNLFLMQDDLSLLEMYSNAQRGVGLEKTVLLAGLTIFVSSASIIISYMVSTPGVLNRPGERRQSAS